MTVVVLIPIAYQRAGPIDTTVRYDWKKNGRCRNALDLMGLEITSITQRYVLRPELQLRYLQHAVYKMRYWHSLSSTPSTYRSGRQKRK